MTLGKRLKYLREKIGKTQLDASAELGLSNVQLSRYESDARKPEPEMIAEFAQYYQTTADYITGLTNDPAPRTPFTVAGKEIELSDDEAKVFLEMKKHPRFTVMFHDLATNPEKKIKLLIKMWEVIKSDVEDNTEHGEGFGELED